MIYKTPKKQLVCRLGELAISASESLNSLDCRVLQITNDHKHAEKKKNVVHFKFFMIRY